MKKKCSKCNIIKNLTDFAKDKSGKFGVVSACKKCKNAEAKNYRKNNHQKIKKSMKNWYENNKDSIKESSKIYYLNNKPEKIKYQQIYYSKNKKHIIKQKKEYSRVKRKTDIQFRLSTILRSRLIGAIKKNSKKGSAIRDLGCSIEELKIYLETQFQPNMTWKNWSKKGWHIDHIIPLFCFDLTNPKHFKKACHYTNLQPMWANENLRKGTKVSKSKHSKADEFMKEQIRHLTKELKRKDQEIRRLEKDLGYNQNKTEKTSKREKEIDLDTCNECGKGFLKVTDIGIRTITTCSLYPDCKYRKVSKL